MVVATEWYDYVHSLFNRQNGDSAHALAGVVRDIVLDDSFWHECEDFVYMVEPILVALRMFDGDQPAMEKFVIDDE